MKGLKITRTEVTPSPDTTVDLTIKNGSNVDIIDLATIHLTITYLNDQNAAMAEDKPEYAFWKAKAGYESDLHFYSGVGGELNPPATWKGKNVKIDIDDIDVPDLDTDFQTLLSKSLSTEPMTK